jgi:YteA family regulatory protein
MEKSRLEHFKNRLIEEKEKVEENINRLENMGVGISVKDATSELSSYDNHPGDMGSETFEIEKNRALKANEVTHIKAIRDALSKIDRGVFGVCEICGRNIEEERLEVVPFTQLCINCQDENDNVIAYKNQRPIEEEVLSHSFGRYNMDDEDYTGFDGEDTWQELDSFNSPNPMLWDDEDDGSEGVVEEIEKVSNEQYKRQLPD